MITVVHGINRRHAEDAKTCRQSAYACAVRKPNYSMPAIHNHLYLIANEPMLAWEDFKAIGYHGMFHVKQI